MKAFTKLTSSTALLTKPNIDTDIIIPARHLKTVKRAGLGAFAFESLRYDANGKSVDNPLDEAVSKGAEILIAGENFGCGSSREHAVWAIADMGIRAIIGLSFADIFRGNCKKNGVLAAVVDEETHAALLGNGAGTGSITIDLETKTITAAGVRYGFSVADDVRDALLEGRDDISDTLDQEAAITAFEERQKLAQPWLYQPLTL